VPEEWAEELAEQGAEGEELAVPEAEGEEQPPANMVPLVADKLYILNNALKKNLPKC
jgi:hypothetical protein